MVSDAKFLRIVRHLKGEKEDARFKFWVEKQRGFQLQDLPGLGIKDAVVVVDKKTQELLRLVPASEIYDIVKQIHVHQLQHSGYKKT